MDRGGTSAGAQRRTKARTKPAPATKRRRPGADRLSALSDELLLHILSFLRIREAVWTSCLSRRWRDLYHHLPSLDFSSEVWDNESSWFIDRVLLLHAAPRIEVFRLSMRVEVGDFSAFRRIDSRLLFAVRRGVRVRDVRIDVILDSDDESYCVPPSVFHCSTLVTSNPTIPRRPSRPPPGPSAMDGRGSTEGMQRRTKPGPATRDRRPGADRFSALSDELLIHILSFLRIREAVSTSRLSRRWRYLYHHLPSLDFSEGFDYESSWPIDRVLLFHAAPRIEVFRLSMRAEMNDEFAFRQIDSRLLFAVRRGVRVLDLHIDVQVFFLDESYGVPPWVFHCRTLEDLSVKKGYLRLPTHVRLVSLKKMRLSLMDFEDNQLECLLRGCPLLQRLELVHCNSYEGDLVIDTREGRSLEELVIVDKVRRHCASKMQIYAPSVKYLSFRSAALRGKYEVRDLSSLVVASFHLYFDGSGVMDEDKVDAFATGLLLRIPQVQVLKLCRWSLQALSKRELRGNLVSALSNVTRLELTIGLEEPQLQAILSALHACCKLRTLVLSILRHMKTLDSSGSDEAEIPQSLALDSDIVMQDLKRIVIQGLTSYYNQNPAGKGGEVEEDFVAKKKGNCIVFIGFLLRISPVLEELIVQPSKGMNKMTAKWELLSNLYSDLLALPRASSCAKVIIDGK